MRTFLAILFASLSLPAADSVVVPAGKLASTTLPALGSTPIRLEVRIHDRKAIHRPESSDIVRLPGMYLANFYGNDSTLACSYAAYIYNLPEDVTIRMQRDPGKKLLLCEAWDTLTGRQIASKAVSIPIAALPAGPLTIGSAKNDARLAFVHLYSTLLPLNSPPPQVTKAKGDIAHYDFEGNSEDVSGHGRNLKWAGGNEAYIATAAYPPVCNAGDPQVFKVGDPVTLDASRSYALDGSESLAFEWLSGARPSLGAFAMSSLSEPSSTITGTVFGNYDLDLKVTDSLGATSVCKVKFGVVDVDDHGVVKLPDESEEDKKRNALLGPLIAYGRNPWPWADDRHRGMANHFGAKLAKDWFDHWNIPGAGTISVVKGSPVVTGSGTSFKNEFCGGGETPKTYNYLIVWYPVRGGGYGRLQQTIKACNSDEQLTLASPYTRSDSASELYYSNDRARYGAWIGGDTNVNYYDNVLAYYSLYYRTGIDTYLEYARTLADRWWTMPWMDEGRYCGEGIGCLAPRLQALTGLTLRALERGDMWPGMRKLWDYYRQSIRSQKGVGDIRENGYELMFVSQCAIVDPDPDHRAACAADVNTALTRWARDQRADKGWATNQYYGGHSSWSEDFKVPGGGTISIENGSTRVIGTGTKWVDSWFKDVYFWVCDNNITGDPVAYFQPKVISPTELELPRAYEGATASGRKWQAASLVGVGTQPFTMGIAASALTYAYRATGNALARQLAIDAAYWIKDHGYHPSTKGLYYARGFPNCEPIEDGRRHCAYAATAGPTQSARFLNGEVFNAISQAYMYTRDESLKTLADEMYGAVFGNPASESLTGDRFFVADLGDGGYSLTANKAKDYGFFFGMGFGAGWPAARLVDVSEPVQRSVASNKRLVQREPTVKSAARSTPARPEATKNRSTVVSKPRP